MSSRDWTCVLGAALLALLTFPPKAMATCPGVCDPVTNPSCCKDDCTYEDAGVDCHPVGEPCRTKTCNGTGSCNQGSFHNDDNGATCITSDPCITGLCNGSQQCVGQTPSTYRCDDGNDCTNDYPQCEVDGQGNFVKCDPTRSGVNVADDTICSSNTVGPCLLEKCESGVCTVTGNKDDGTPCGAITNGTTCAVKQCASGECSGTQLGSPVTCTPTSCQSFSCAFVNNAAQCTYTNLERGTVCDDDPWDCTHKRCGLSGNCKSFDTTTLKECDANTGTSSHCKLSYCDRGRHCRTGTEYIHYLGQNIGSFEIENATTKSRHSITKTALPTCASTDGNVCTTDRCVGNLTDACSNVCDVNSPCPIPACGDICDVVSGTCTCRDVP